MPAKKAPAKKQPAKKASGRKVASAVETIAAEAAKSPQVQDRLDRIGMKVLENIEYVLEHGSEQQRDSITDRLFKTMLSAQGKNTTAGVDEEERAEFRRMMAKLGGAISE